MTRKLKGRVMNNITHKLASNTKTIDYIRNHYLVLDYETVTITEVDGAYKFTN